MLKWLQDRIKKKTSSPASQPVEVASEAVSDVTISAQVESGYGEGRRPPDLARTQLLGSEQDPVGSSNLRLPERRQGDEAVASHYVCPLGCLATDLLHNHHSGHSFTTKREKTLLDTHCLHQHVRGSIHLRQCTKDTSNQQTDGRNPSNSNLYKSSSVSPQTHRETTVSLPVYLNVSSVSVLKQEERNASSSQPYHEGNYTPPECAKSCLSPQKHEKGTMHIPATLGDKKSATSIQNFGSCDLNVAENVTIEKCAECVISTRNCSVNNSKEHKECVTNEQEHIPNLSNRQEHTEQITVPQEHEEKSQHVMAIAQKDTGNTLRPQQHLKCISTSQEHILNANSTQTSGHDTSSTQVLKLIKQKPPQYHRCQYSSSPFDLTDNAAVTAATEGEEITSVKPQLDPAVTSKHSIVGHESQNHWEDRKDNSKQEARFTSQTENSSVDEANLSQMSNQPVDEVASSQSQERNTFEKVNQYLREDPKSSVVENEEETHETKTEAASQVIEAPPSMGPEKELIRHYDTVLSKDEETGAAVAKIDRHSQTNAVQADVGNVCPSLCCLHQTCLYNQEGRKCTVLGELYIVTYLEETPVLVRTTMEDSGMGPMGCANAWLSGKAIEFRELKDGTKVYFDAVVSPKTLSFVTLVIWLDEKPVHSIEPYYNCYTIVDMMRNCPLNLVSFAKENGVVLAHINGKTVNVMFSKSVMHIDGEKVKGAKEIRNLLKTTSKPLYGDVLKLMTLDAAGKVGYGFTCSCIWQGCKPLHSIVYDPFKLYRSSPGCFVVAGKQSLLLCDKNATLETRGTSYNIIFKNEGQLIELVCDKRKLFSNNHRFQHPANGKVKVHLRKQSVKGACTWIVLMVQMQPSSQTQQTSANDSQLKDNKGAAAQSSPTQTSSTPVSNTPLIGLQKCSPRPPASPGGIELHHATSDIDGRDTMPRPQNKMPREANYNGFDGYCGNAIWEKLGKTAASCNDTVSVAEEKCIGYLGGNTQNFCSSEASSRSTVGEVTNVSGVWEKQNPELLVQGDKSSYFHNGSYQDNQHIPMKLIQNCSGVLKNVAESYILEASVAGEVMHINIGKTPWVASDNGKGKWCKPPMPDMSVGFDAYFVDFPSVGPVGHILAIWSGKKPLKTTLESTTFFYDVPGVYHGINEEGYLKFIVMLDGNLSFITTGSTPRIFKGNGEHHASIAMLSHVFLHLSVSHGSWTVLLVVLQPELKHTSLVLEESGGACPKSSSLPELNVEKNCRQLSHCKTKTSTIQKTCEVPKMQLTHYLRNLHGTLAEKSGERVIITHHKDIPLSVAISKDCNVDMNAVAQNIENIPIGTKLHCDAFCENLKSVRYWAVLVWLEKKPKKSVSHLGSTFYYNVSGKCLESSEEEVSFEIFLESKSKHLVSRGGYIIMPDGSYRAPRDLKVGTAIQVNLLQHYENLSINQFIYISTHAAQDIHPYMLPEGQLGEGNKPANCSKKETNQMKPGVAKLPLSASQENLKHGELQSRVAETSFNSSCEDIKNIEMIAAAAESHTNSVKEVKENVKVKPKGTEFSPSGSQENFKDGKGKPGSPSVASLTTDKINVTAISPNPVMSEYEYMVAKGIISQPQENVFTFTDDTGKLTVNINPLTIAVDLASGSSLLTGQFYLVYHSKTQVGVCGWYQHSAKEVYLQLSMRVHAHNTQNKILTLGLPNKTSHYNFIFDNEVLVKGGKVQRQEALKSGLTVHPIIEDIEPCMIDGNVVSHRIAFVTTVKGVAAACVNFLKHSLHGKEGKKVPNIDQPLCHSASVNFLPENSDIQSYWDGGRRVLSQVGGRTPTPSVDMASDLLKQQPGAKGNNDIENSSQASLGFPTVSQGYLCSEISTFSSKVHFSENNHIGNIPSVDAEGDALQELISSRVGYPHALSKTHMIQYVTLYGEVLPGNSGKHVFSTKSLASPLELPAKFPHLDASVSCGSGNFLMLARKICLKEAGTVSHYPVVMWPEGKQCDPYIVVSYKVVWKHGFLQVTDAIDGSDKWYMCNYNSVLSLKNTYNINEVIASFSKQGKKLVLYALVDNIPPLKVKGHYVQGNILLLTTCKRIAIAAVDIFIGIYHEDMVFQIPDGPIGKLLLLYKIRMSQALMCKRGTTCYYPAKEKSIVSGIMVVGGFLMAHTDDFAILRCNKRTTTAVCHVSNIYCQGLKITSWKDIPEKLRGNFWAVILPLDETVKEGNWEVDAVALVAWCRYGPKMLATHECYYHILTLYVPQVEPEEIQLATHTNRLHSNKNFHPLPLRASARAVISQTELESWQCPAGSTIFAFHESILQCSDLLKIEGKVSLVSGNIILFTSAENEMVVCQMSDVFIKGKQCQDVRKIMNEIDQTYNIYARKCPHTTYSGKTVSIAAVIAFTGPLKSIGIHVCKKHSCVFNSSFHSLGIVIAEQVFHDIAVWCKQSSKCSDYYLSQITIPEGETPIPLPNTVKTKYLKISPICDGVVVGLEKESDDHVRIRVTLQEGSGSLTLPVCRSYLMGLDRDIPLQRAIGHPLKVILHTTGTDYGEGSRILMAWGSFSQEGNVFPRSTDEPKGLDTQLRSKSLCCPRAFVVKEFQSVFNTDMFELESLCKFRNVDGSGTGFFHCGVDRRLVSCKVQCIVGQPKVSSVKMEFWNLLVPRAAYIGNENECPEAVAAWLDVDSLAVRVCDIHGVKGLNVSCWGKGKMEIKSALLSAASMRWCHSEPENIGQPVCQKLIQVSRSRLISESQTFSPCADPSKWPSSIVVEDDLSLSRSLPSGMSLVFACGYEMRNREYIQDLQHCSGSTTLLTTDEGSAIGEEGSIIEGTSEKVMCTLSVNGDYCEYSPWIGDEEDITFKCTVTTIKSSTFICTDSHHGLLIDSVSNITALVSQGKLYINKEKTKEPLQEIFGACNPEIINAIIVPLATHVTIGGLRVTHEALVAWVGPVPEGIGGKLRNMIMSALTSGPLMQDKTVSMANCEHEGDFRGSVLPKMTKPHKGSLWAARPTLRVIYANQEILSACCLEDYADHCGILKSTKGAILFDRQLVNVEAVPRTPQAGQEGVRVEALVLELEQPIEILSCKIKRISVVMWSKDKPVMDDSLITRNLEVYKMNWIVVIIYNLSDVVKRLSLNKGTCRSFQEISSFSDYSTSDLLQYVCYCSPNYSVQKHEVKLVLSEHVLLKHQENIALALKSDIKCSIAEGRCVQVIAVRLVEPFNYCSHLITHFALLVYTVGFKLPEAVAIMSDWSRGKIEKVALVGEQLDDGLVKVSILVKINKAAGVKPLSFGPLWPLTQDRPEGDMIFAAECEVYKLMSDCGIMKITAITLNGNEIKMFFLKGAVLINEKHLSEEDSMDLQMVPVPKKAWHCTGQRLSSQERQSVMKRTGEEAQYKAFLVWCEVCTLQNVKNKEGSENEIKPILSAASTQTTTLQSTAGSDTVSHVLQQVEDEQVVAAARRGTGSLCTVNTPTTTASQSRIKHNSETPEDPRNGSNQHQKSIKVGRVTEVHPTVAQVALENEQLQYVARDRCFVYGVCLEKVELWHVFSIGLPIDYELTEDGKEVKGVWVGGTDSLDPSFLLHTLQQWCHVNNVTPCATSVLLMEAGWLPSDLTPTVASEEDVKVVEVVGLHGGS